MLFGGIIADETLTTFQRENGKRREGERKRESNRGVLLFVVCCCSSHTRISHVRCKWLAVFRGIRMKSVISMSRVLEIGGLHSWILFSL
jgi:hypothetical protein